MADGELSNNAENPNSTETRLVLVKKLINIKTNAIAEEQDIMREASIRFRVFVGDGSGCLEELDTCCSWYPFPWYGLPRENISFKTARAQTCVSFIVKVQYLEKHT